MKGLYVIREFGRIFTNVLAWIIKTHTAFVFFPGMEKLSLPILL